MSMPWLSSLNTGVRGFDDDHHHLFEVLDAIRASLAVDNVSGVRALFSELQAATIQHFVMEEALMDRHRYPAAAGHRADHDRSRAALAVLAAHLDGGRLSRFAEALDRYGIDYFHGVLRHDGMLARFLRDRAALAAVS